MAGFPRVPLYLKENKKNNEKKNPKTQQKQKKKKQASYPPPQSFRLHIRSSFLETAPSFGLSLFAISDGGPWPPLIPFHLCL